MHPERSIHRMRDKVVHITSGRVDRALSLGPFLTATALSLREAQRQASLGAHETV